MHSHVCKTVDSGEFVTEHGCMGLSIFDDGDFRNRITTYAYHNGVMPDNIQRRQKLLSCPNDGRSTQEIEANVIRLNSRSVLEIRNYRNYHVLEVFRLST